MSQPRNLPAKAKARAIGKLQIKPRLISKIIYGKLVAISNAPTRIRITEFQKEIILTCQNRPIIISLTESLNWKNKNEVIIIKSGIIKQMRLAIFWVLSLSAFSAAIQDLDKDRGGLCIIYWKFIRSGGVGSSENNELKTVWII